MSDFTKACIEANREVYHQLNQNYTPELLEKFEQGAGGDISMKADLVAEDIFVKHLGSFGTIESEESGQIGHGAKKIIIDPLDGSANFASGFPYYGTSIACLDENGMLSSAQVCNLTNGNLFIKQTDKKAVRKNLFDDSVSYAVEIKNPEIGLFEKAYMNPKIARSLLKHGYKFRSPGAIALSLAYAKNVTFFLFAGEARIYDLVAGLALCEELEVIVEEDYVIVSQSKSIAQNIESIVLRSMK